MAEISENKDRIIFRENHQTVEMHFHRDTNFLIKMKSAYISRLILI